MNRNVKKSVNYQIPSQDATVFEFEINGTADRRVIIKVERTDTFFSHINNDEDAKVLIGDYKQLIEYLYKIGAQWLVRKKNKTTTRKLFFGKADAIHLMKEGYSVYHIPSSTIMSYDEEYSKIILSTSEIRNVKELPGGAYCVAWLEERIQLTFKQVQAKRQRLKNEEELAKEAKEKETIRQTAKIKLEQQQQEHGNAEKNSISIPQPKQNPEANEAEGFGWKDLAWIGVVIVGGILLCPLLKKKTSKPQSLRTAF